MILSCTTERKKRIQSLRSLFLTLNWMAYKEVGHYLQSYGLTHPQFVTLIALTGHQKAARMTDLSEVTGQDAPTMTGIVNRLVKSALLERKRDEQDRRVVLVEATPAGIALAEKIRSELEQEDLQGFAALTDQDLDNLETFFDHLLRMYLRRKHPDDIIHDLESIKQDLQSFENDPITFMKRYMCQNREMKASDAYEADDLV